MSILDCCAPSRTDYSGKITPERKLDAERIRLHEARVTAVALVIVALFIAGSGLILMGIGTSPSTMHVGYGIFPYLAGSQMVLLGGGVLTGALIFAGIAYYHNSRTNHFKLIAEAREAGKNELF